jgi:hypothetical protein
LNYQTFSNWAQKAVPAGGFIEVSGKLTGGGTEGESRTGYGIVVGSGPVKVHLPAGVTQADLALVVQVLR